MGCQVARGLRSNVENEKKHPPPLGWSCFLSISRPLRAQYNRVPAAPCPTRRRSPVMGPSKTAFTSSTMRCCAWFAVSHPRILCAGLLKKRSATASNVSDGKNPVALRSFSCIRGRTSTVRPKAAANGRAVSTALVSALLTTRVVPVRTSRSASWCTL